MRLSFVMLLAFIASGCGTSPKQSCLDLVSAQCAKMWGCPASMGATLKIGTDEASCRTQYGAFCSIVEKGMCADGKAYDTQKATTCAADIAKESCDQYATATHPGCDSICQ